MEQQGRNKKFIKDIFIYGAGSLGAKLITFILFPLYTFFIRPDNLGYYEIALATVFFIMPIVNLQLRDGVFRFLIDNKDENIRRDVINQSYRLMSVTMLAAFLLFLILSSFIEIRCGYYILAMLLTMSFYEVQIQIVRGLGHTKLFVGCGILSVILIALFSVLFVILLRWDIEGIFLANILARLLVIIFMEIKLSIIRNYFSLHRVANAETGKSLLKYCCPLILVVSLMWVIGNSYRYFITHHLGLYAYGVFAAVFKFAAIIEIFGTVVFQAWQETSVLQLKAKDRDHYYSSVLSSYLLLLAGFVITLSFILQSFYTRLVDTEYESSAIYLYVLCVAEIGYALQAFISAIFHAEKKTMQMFYVALASAIVSLILYFFFIQWFGLMGIAIAFGLSYFFMSGYYLILIRKSIKIKFSAQSLIVSILILTGGGWIFYHTDHSLWRVIYWFICIAAIYLTLPQTIVSGIKHRITDKISGLRK